MTPVSLVRIMGIVEGLSWLVLLLVAMPLKYILGYPAAVKVAGMAHGVLFLGYVLALLRAHLECGWPVKRSALLFVASMVPFGFVFADRSLRAEASRGPEVSA